MYQMKMRCFGDGDEDYSSYHDTEWGRPVHDENQLFERLSLEGFQSGLSWLTILRKRNGFRAAFAGFRPEAVAQFTEDDVARLLQDTGIVRNGQKIRATIANAQALLDLHDSGRSLEGVMWSHRPVAHERPRSLDDLRSSTPESVALSRELKSLGFRFVGPTTAYAAMQACGIVDDHLSGCFLAGSVGIG